MPRPQVSVQKTQTLTGHSDSVFTLERSGQAEIIFSSGGDGQVAMWNLKEPDKGRLIAKVPASVYALHYWADRNVLIVGQNFEGIHLIDLEDRKEIGSVKLTDAAIFDIKTRENQAWVATGDGTVLVVDLGQMQVVHRVKHSEKSARCIAISPDGNEVAVGYSDHTLRIFDAKSGTLRQTVEAHGNSVFTVAYAPGGHTLITGSRDARIKVWQRGVQGYQLKQEVVAHMYAINHISFRPDGRYFATGSMDKAVKVWDAESYQLLKVIDKARHAGHGTSVNKLLWTSLDNQLVSASDDRTLSVWDVNIENT